MDYLGEDWAVLSPSAEMGVEGAQESRRTGVSLPHPGKRGLAAPPTGSTRMAGPLACFFFFWPHHAACRILVSQPGTGPGPLAVKALSPNHWTTGWGGGVLMSSSSPELVHTGQTVGGTSQGIAQSLGI